MPKCNICTRDAQPGKALCSGCLNNWLVVRSIIQQRLYAQYGEATRETDPILQREMKRLDTLWRRDRNEFEKEINTWYTPTT